MHFKMNIAKQSVALWLKKSNVFFLCLTLNKTNGSLLQYMLYFITEYWQEQSLMKNTSEWKNLKAQ